MSDFTAAELRARIQKQVRFPEHKRNELRDEQAEQDAREESDCHADAIEALDQLEAAQDFNQ